MPFMGLWLKSRGLDADEIGIIIAIPHVMKVITAPYISQLADRREEYWRPLIICTAVSLFFFAFYFVAEGFWVIFLVSLAVNSFMPAMMPLFETITLNQMRKYNLNYGPVRAVGSASFIVATIWFGLYLKNNSIEHVIWASFIALAFFLMTATILPRGNKKIRSNDSESSKPISELLKDNRFALFLLIVGLIQMSHGVYYAMGSIHWDQAGLGEDVIGFLWAVGILAEIIIFVFCEKLFSRINVYYLLILVAVAGSVRWVVIATSFSISNLFFVQLFHGLTYGAAHLVAIKYIKSDIPEKYSGTAQSLYTALPMGIAMAISTYLGSVAYGAIGFNAFYIMSGLCLCSIICSVIALRLNK